MFLRSRPSAQGLGFRVKDIREVRARRVSGFGSVARLGFRVLDVGFRV